MWDQIDIKKGLLPQMYACLKNAGFGAHTDLYSNFTHFVSILPIFNFESPFETIHKLDQLGGKKKLVKEIKEETKEEIKEEKGSKNKKKEKKGRGKAGEGVSKTIKNSFSISEKANVMFETMKALLNGINVEEAIAFNEEIINSYYDTISFFFIKRILPAIEALEEKNDSKTVEILNKKAIQSFMLPATEYLKKNDSKLSRSLYSSIPQKFVQILSLFSSQGIPDTKLEGLFEDIHETLVIGLEKSPHNTIKLLSVLLSETSNESSYFQRIQKIGAELIQNLYK